MSDRITLTLRAPLERTLDADAIAADRFAALSAQEISALQLWDGRKAVALGDMFSVSGERSQIVVLEGDLAKLRGVGSAMSAGTLEITGNIGNAVGARMQGGTIAVQGSAGDDAGSAMSGGSLVIAGDAGDRVGGATAGCIKGDDRRPHHCARQRGARGRGPHASRHSLLRIGRCGRGARDDRRQHHRRGRDRRRRGLRQQARVDRRARRRARATDVRVRLHLSSASPLAHAPLASQALRLAVDDAHVHGPIKRYSGDLAEIGKGEILEWQST